MRNKINRRGGFEMHYPIDKELHSLYLHKLPANIKFYSRMNAILHMFKCESDDAVNVTTYETPGYQNEIIQTYVIEPKMQKGNYRV